MNIKKTKIVATIGPVSESESVLTTLVKAGMNVCRLNFSHKTLEEAIAQTNTIRTVAKKLGKTVAIMQDLSGPKIRIGDFYKERVMLKKGSIFTLTTKMCVGDETHAYINYNLLPSELKAEDFVLLDDGKKKLQVISISKNEIKCRVIVGGETKGKRGVNLPGVSLKISCLTPKDKKDILFGLEYNVDFVALSFVRRPSDIRELRAILNKAKSKAKIISKIETAEAIGNLDAIIAETDAVMVARGDLAVEVPTEQVPTLQKMIVKKCNRAGKPVIVATQMMESMIKSPVPTRAEVSDVANSILDGADAVMLSEESTLGEFPVETVTMMSKIATEVEKNYPHREVLYRDVLNYEEGENHKKGRDVIDVATFGVVSTADAVGAVVIVALTDSGFTARMISRFRPRQEIIAMSPHHEVTQQLALSFGCHPVFTKKTNTLNDAIGEVRTFVLKNKFAKKGDKVVLSAGIPFGKTGGTNMLLIEVI
ncbi:MAG: pyruvate kinase [Candidatus Yonathbacteria bacterium]|nr:pyruvate kinase [Candidatus Yonathbacteria bacterium]